MRESVPELALLAVDCRSDFASSSVRRPDVDGARRHGHGDPRLPRPRRSRLRRGRGAAQVPGGEGERGQEGGHQGELPPDAHDSRILRPFAA